MSTICEDAGRRNEQAALEKAAYVANGTDLDGKKDVLGIWLGARET